MSHSDLIVFWMDLFGYLNNSKWIISSICLKNNSFAECAFGLIQGDRWWPGAWEGGGGLVLRFQLSHFHKERL